MYLKYNETSGEVTDGNGTTYLVGCGLPSFRVNLNTEARLPLSTKEILSLKEQGFDAKEIIEMRKEGVI